MQVNLRRAPPVLNRYPDTAGGYGQSSGRRPLLRWAGVVLAQKMCENQDAAPGPTRRGNP